MTLRQQQLAVFFATVLVIFSLFGAGVWLIARRLTTEATLQTALLMARQVEIALADSLRDRPVPRPRTAPPQASTGGFWSFLGRIFPGPGRSTTPAAPARPPSRQTEVRGLMRAFIDRSGAIEAMWVLNADGKVLYRSMEQETADPLAENAVAAKIGSGVTTINAISVGSARYYDVLVPLQMPAGVKGPGGLRLWINPADWTELASALWRQLALLFVLSAAVALVSGLFMTALYTRRFRLIAETLREAEAGTYQARPAYDNRDEVAASLDLIDRLVMKQRKTAAVPAPAQRLAVAARTLAHEVRTPLNAVAVHLEVLKNSAATTESANGKTEKSIAALDSSIRQVERLVRDFTDYSAPVTMEKKELDIADVLSTSVQGVSEACKAQNIALTSKVPPGPLLIRGDAARLRQSLDNLLRNAMEAQPKGGAIDIQVDKKDGQVIVSVKDSGPGVPPERRPALFEFGKTTKPGGSGIGLPLSQLIAEAHGGTLSYCDNNGHGRGATFQLALPLEAS